MEKIPEHDPLTGELKILDDTLNISPFTHTVNWDEVNNIEDIKVILSGLDLVIDPDKWVGNKKYIQQKNG